MISSVTKSAKIEADKGLMPRRRARRERFLPNREGFLQPVPAWLWCFVTLGLAWSCFTPNPLFTACSLLMLPLLASLLWFRDEPPVLLFACFIQWMQATMGIFYSNLQNVPLASDPDVGGGGMVEEATWLSMAGVLALAIGMRLALRKREKKFVEQAQQEVRSLRIERVFALYLFTFIFSFAIGLLAWRIPSLTQPLLAFSTIRWVMVFLLVYAVVVNRRQYGLLAFVICLETLIGFTGFFSGFKSIFFVLLIALAGTGSALKGRQLVQLTLVAVVLFILAVSWTEIKGDYRNFVNQGTGQQIVAVPMEQRLEKLRQLSSAMNAAKFEDGFERLLLRISYVQYFALSIQNVPSNIPYQNGQLWWDSIKRVFMPRLFFPDKPVLDDSAECNYFAGVYVAGAEQGTSISIGYFGESYIDFGPVGMFAPIFLLGLFHGLIYRFFIAGSQRKIIGMAITVSILALNACLIETSNAKIFGGNVVVCIAMVLLLIFGEKSAWNFAVRPAGRANKRALEKNSAPDSAHTDVIS